MRLSVEGTMMKCETRDSRLPTFNTFAPVPLHDLLLSLLVRGTHALGTW
jgi:hypothetical protein